MQPATQLVSVGETYDFEFTPPAPGAYELSVVFVPPPGLRVTRPPWRQPLIVR